MLIQKPDISLINLFFPFFIFFKKKQHYNIHPSYLKLTLLWDEFHLSPFPHHMTPLLHCTSSVPIWAQLPIPSEHTFWYTCAHTCKLTLTPGPTLQYSPKHYHTHKIKDLNTTEWNCRGNQSSRAEAEYPRVAHRFWEPIITLETKLTMAVAGWSGSNSANRWLTLSVVLPCFLATKPKNLQWKKRKQSLTCSVKTLPFI